MTTWGVVSLEPRGLIGRIYLGDNYTLLHTQYISCGLMVSEKKNFFFVFPNINLLGANHPQDVASLGPRGLTGRIFVGDH